MVMLQAEVADLLNGTPIAHLATVLPDGSPHSAPLWIATHGEHVAIMTGPGSRKARNLRRDRRVAVSLTPADAQFPPIMLRGRVVEWLEGEEAWTIIDEISAKYTGHPYARDQERVVCLIEIDHQRLGLG